MRFGLIIAAGKQTRFKSDIPKALVKVNDVCLLDKNIKNLKTVCDEVFVVCSTQNQDYFKNYKTLVIESGLGCGDAVMKALDLLFLLPDDTVFVQWGDCLIEPKIYNKCIDNFDNKKDTMIIPAVWEEKPYVQLIQNMNDTLKVQFSKFGDIITEGFHDLSVFYGDALNLLRHLKKFSLKYRLNGGYEHKHGNEFNFLDVFNETDLKGFILFIENYKDISFNTMEEFLSLNKI